MLAVAFGLVAVSDLATNRLCAGDWMFRRSYYSHALTEDVDVPYPLPRARSAHRPAYVGNHPGFSVRGGFRFNRVRIRSGNSIDTTILRENWFEIRP